MKELPRAMRQPWKARSFSPKWRPGTVRAERVSLSEPRLFSLRAVNLPNAQNAVVERSKVVDYLLAAEHPEGGGKAEFFTRFGFTADDWKALADALIAHAREHPVSSFSESKYGAKYRIDGLLPCPDGRAPSIRAVWIVNSGTDAPRLVTAHPL